MQTPSERVPAVLEDPGVDVSDPRELLLSYLDWYRQAVMRKIAGLSDTAVRTPVEPLGWSPLGLVKHLGWVERRWMRWGVAGQDVLAYHPGGDEAEWNVPAEESTDSVLSAYFDEVRESRSLAAGAALSEPAKIGGRFKSAEEARPHWDGSCSTCCRSTRATSVSSTSPASSSTG